MSQSAQSPGAFLLSAAEWAMPLHVCCHCHSRDDNTQS